MRMIKLLLTLTVLWAALIACPVRSLSQATYNDLTIFTSRGKLDVSGMPMTRGAFCAYTTDTSERANSFGVGGNLQAIKSAVCRPSDPGAVSNVASGLKVAGNVAAATADSTCIAANQHTANAGTDIQQCIEALPPAPSTTLCNTAGGGIIDATGYAGSQTIAGLTIDRPIILNLGAATYDVTGVIVANNQRCGVTIQGDGARLLADTGAGKPVMDFTGSSSVFLRGFQIRTGVSNLSTIGILEARSMAQPHTWWHHFQDIQVQLQSQQTANRGHGTIGIYNYASEITHYENTTVGADNPIVGTRSNIFGVTAPTIPFYSGPIPTTMDAVEVDGKSDLYSSLGPAMTLDGAAEWNVDLGEAAGASLIGVPAFYITGNTNDLKISGEFEYFTRVLHLDNGAMFNDMFRGTCANCQFVAYSGNISYTVGSTTATPSSMTNLATGQMLTSTAVPFGTYIAAVGASTITLSQAATTGGTVASTTGEPVYLIDGTHCTAACDDFSRSSFSTESYNRQPAYYMIGLGSTLSGSGGWTATLSEGSSVSLPVSADGNPMAGTIIVPHENGLPSPYISSNIYGMTIAPGGISINTGKNTANFYTFQANTANLTTANITTLTSGGPVQLQQSTGASQYFNNVPGSGWGAIRGYNSNGVAIGANTGNGNGVLIDANANETVPGNIVGGTHLDQSKANNFAGFCVMSNSTSCTIPLNAAYNSAPLCIATAQGSTPIAASCGVGGTTVTITAASINSNTWAAVIIGNPN